LDGVCAPYKVHSVLGSIKTRRGKLATREAEWRLDGWRCKERASGGWSSRMQSAVMQCTRSLTVRHSVHLGHCRHPFHPVDQQAQHENNAITLLYTDCLWLKHHDDPISILNFDTVWYTVFKVFYSVFQFWLFFWILL
jgi:hypothetical protein